LLALQARADSASPFADQGDNAKRHVASGFSCPAKIGSFERDAVGSYDLASGADFCAYSARDGVYGTIVIKPLSGPYDPRASLAGEFAVQERTGGRMLEERNAVIDHSPQIYERRYVRAQLQDVRYCVLFSGEGTGNWAVETTVEYAEPRDIDAKNQFLTAVYRAAFAELPLGAPPLAAAGPPR
jgi:hypothetical protein